MSGYYSRSFLADAIMLYQTLPCLWKVKSEGYKNRELREKALKKLIDKFREVNPGENKNSVLKRFNSLRNTWRKEYKKVIESKKSGDEAENIYSPTLWYYDIFSFLQDQESPTESMPSPVDEDDTNMSGEEEENEADGENYPVIQSGSLTTLPQSSYFEDFHKRKPDEIPKSLSKRSRQHSQSGVESDSDEILTLIKSKLENPETLDRYDHLAKNWAQKLRQLDPFQRIFVEKLVTDTFYEAELGKLSENSKLFVGCTIPQILPYSHQISPCPDRVAPPYPQCLPVNPGQLIVNNYLGNSSHQALPGPSNHFQHNNYDY